jgi:hypothetical protein
VITKKTITSAVAAGWISFPEPKARELSRNWAQPIEAFDGELAYRLWDNGADTDTVARAIGCKRRFVAQIIQQHKR